MKNKVTEGGCFFLLLFLLQVVLAISCSNHSANNKIDAGNKKEKNMTGQKPASSFSDTIRIDFAAAVFYTPDSIQLEKIRALTDSMIFDGTMHELFYQMRNSRLVLTNHYPNIPILEVKNARYLLFEKRGGIKECVDLNLNNDPCGIFIFDGNKAPQLADMTNIESELGFYFSN